MLKINGLKFSYSTTSSWVLDIPHFEVKKGERLFLHGPSGSGKSTLLGVLAGILTPQLGTLEISGQNIGKMNASERDHFRGSHLGYIFQMFNLIPYLSVGENIRLPCELNKDRQKRAGDNLAEKSLELATRLGIARKIKDPVSSLSVGQQQRVACARALLGSPDLIIADEPTSALDTAHRERFLNLLFEECERSQSTLIFVSHDQGLQSQFSRSVSLSEVNLVRFNTSDDETFKPSTP
jgi:putative ABC transport system ATP-binding protein